VEFECDGELEKTRRAREKKIMNKKIKKGKRKKNKKEYLIDIWKVKRIYYGVFFL
jgi:hypothetical protein